MNRKRIIALVIAISVFFVSIIVNFASMAFTTDITKALDTMFKGSDQEFIETVKEDGNEFKKIAVLEVEGVIQDTGTTGSMLRSAGYNHRFFMDLLDQVQHDDTVKAIVLRVNSPGGGVAESAEIHDKLKEIKQKAKKPIYVSMGSVAASGGYYISAPADKIMASPETLTGSLGVIMQSVNYSKLADKFGVDFVTVKSGPYKDIMSPTRPITDSEKQILQEMINNTYNGFVKVISEGRKIPESQVRKIADGRIYDGRQAKELKLIDDFGYLDDTIQQLKKDHHLSGAEVVKYEQQLGFSSLFSASAQKIIGKDAEMHDLMKVLSNPNSPRLMYLYAE
ncbi:protease-4 [Oikeobacillus pervagus]|uniref:Protease-4 n=1 Tax=Oikeobacillus pervagus TaxID=1325931 RepID=A0AAJ1WKD5_9BACI|nr:signal peptide peptidase SppA [Oikeobacillus pervagus]MDQ0215011.1 protease-4 [Oikeobacillus pervagus]